MGIARTAVGVVTCVAYVAGCGSDGDEDTDATERATSVRSDSSNEPSIQCATFDLASGTAGEKLNAALCFGLGAGTVLCEYDAVGDYSHCEVSSPTGDSWYEVEFYQSNGVTYGNTYGAKYPDLDGPIVAVVYQADDGSFRYFDPSTEAELMFCTVVGDVANKCLWQ